MKSSIDHLPLAKKDQIFQAKDLIFSKIPDVVYIILFGSYAKGEWVEDRFFENGILYEYVSDFDVLIVTKNPISLTEEYLYQDKIVNAWKHRTPINPHVQDLNSVNDGLERGQYFFIEILREGICLFKDEQIKFSEPILLSEWERKEIAAKNFEKFYSGANRVLKYAKIGFEQSLSDKDDLRDITFLLHQVVERFYSSVLLVYGNFKPKTHNLAKLRENIKAYSKDLYHLFSPLPENKEETLLFNLLKKSYIGARYNDDFPVTEKEITLLLEKMDRMAKIVKDACAPKIS
jgi:uncharacterized protein|tara:strand:+ start:602 stop:1471 length:870 start_codon:yes stop_codon:yes gene_type:complete